MDPIVLRVYVWMFLSNLKMDQNITVPDVSWTIPNGVLGTSGGTLNLSNILVTGLETLTNEVTNINATEDEHSNNNLCILLPIEKLQLSLDYNVDIGSDGEIPIYGDGKFLFAQEKTEYSICMYVNFNERYLDDVIFRVTYHHKPLQITGFWNHREVNLIVEGLLNTINRFLAMWNVYEPERASCVSTPFVSYVLNRRFGNENATFEFDSACLKKIFFDGADTIDISALQLKVYIWMFLSNLKTDQNITVPDVSWTFSDNVQGTLSLSNVLVTGLETLTSSPDNINVTEDEDENNNACILIPIERLQLNLDYVADIGIDNEIPIYGDGSFLFAQEKIEYTICMFINFNERYLDDVVFRATYRHKPITGFWKHSEVSLILEGLLNIINRFVAMWNVYEPERASCISTPFVSYVLNRWFGNENATFEFDSTCLKEILFDGTEDIDIHSIEEHILGKMLDAHANGVDDNILNQFAEENKLVMLPILAQVAKKLL
ncbi:hypothetical protein NQ315_008066 [Exocentrus adspersus]|uniref:Uncharacterized protein n=1 Tax=Exocentrus adspersus TaxID=1586481 RepID=A0AAV8VWE0_9CUCU|nr:hypothetical protein NQ315_008066 [Exocentrus adspersus]